MEILCLTCYAPLHSYKWSNKITPSKELLEIYDLQFTNYKEEKKKGLLIKSIAKIKDDVSIKVKQQYEEISSDGQTLVAFNQGVLQML